MQESTSLQKLYKVIKNENFQVGSHKNTKGNFSACEMEIKHVTLDFN